MGESNRLSDPEFNPEEADWVVKALIDHPRVTWQADPESDALIAGVRDELLVRRSAPQSVRDRAADLSVGKKPLRRLSEAGVSTDHDIEIYRIEEHNLQPIEGNTNLDSFDWARDLCQDVDESTVEGKRWLPVSPNHIAVVAVWRLCPYGMPGPAASAGPGWVPPFAGDGSLNVVLLDTGFIPSNQQLLSRGGFSAELGEYDDLTVVPPVTKQAAADGADLDGDSNLDGIAGHGTFTLGLLARRAPTATITSLGLRELGLRSGTFVTEWELALAIHAAASRPNVQVVLSQFAFPTLRGAIPQPIYAVLSSLDPGTPAIVAPAGNDSNSTKYYPAALDRVIGVGATKEGVSTQTVDFSNYGDWVDCYAGGENVFSTYIDWPGDTGTNPEVGRFDGWATWNGTCFSAAKVAAEIAARWESHGGAVTPTTVFENMKSGLEPDLTPVQVEHNGAVQSGKGFDLEEEGTSTPSQSS